MTLVDRDQHSSVAGPTAGSVLGEELVHLVTAVRLLDTLATDIRRAGTVRKDMETRSSLAAMVSLYGMTFTGRGRECLVRAVTSGRHTDCLLALVRHSSTEGKKDMKKSAIRGFASELLLLTVRTSDDMSWLRRYGSELVELGRHDEHSKLSELVGWCGPLAELGPEEVFLESAVPQLAEIVRRFLGQEAERAAEGPGHDLVTAARILKHLVAGSTRQDSRVNSRTGHWSSDIHTQLSEAALSERSDTKNFKNTLAGLKKHSLFFVIKLRDFG